jgi:phosphoribosyl 1,2-cyclic phosphate phosphodiesterase
VKTIDESEIHKLKGLKVLVINVLGRTALLPFKPRRSLDLIALLNLKTYLTHISHHFGFMKRYKKSV